jgi:hypothetical protein
VTVPAAATRLGLAVVALLALPLAGCSPKFEFLVLNATAGPLRLQGRRESCVAAPGRTCSARELFVALPNGASLEYRPLPAVGTGVLMDAGEHRFGRGYLVRMRFDGETMQLVAARDDSWTPLSPQPRGFPLKPARLDSHMP